MALFIFDNTFEGLLTSVFEAYSRRTFPDALLAEGEPLPLFCDETFTVVSDEEKAGRVWRGLQKKLSASALSCLTQCCLSSYFFQDFCTSKLRTLCGVISLTVRTGSSLHVIKYCAFFITTPIFFS